MPYSLDLRTRVVAFVENGGGITRASKLFQVSRTSIYRWFNRTHLQATKVQHRQRKLDWFALEKDVAENPELRLIDRAKKFGVKPSAIFYALKKIKINRKKRCDPASAKDARERAPRQNNFVIEKEIDK